MTLLHLAVYSSIVPRTISSKSTILVQHIEPFTSLDDISYPTSKWDNIRDNMGSSSGSSTSVTSPTSTSVTVPTSSSATTSATTPSQSSGTGSGQCANVAAWTSAVSRVPHHRLAYADNEHATQVAYTGGQTAVYNGHLWTAKWWTEADTPGGSG